MQTELSRILGGKEIMTRSHELSKYRNIGIMAHIDAGKTTTTAKLAKYLENNKKNFKRCNTKS